GPELGDPHDAIRLRRLLREDLDAVAEMELGLVGAVLVDHHLVARARWASRRDEVERVETLVGIPAETQARRTLPRVADRLVLLVDDLRVVELHVAFGRRHPPHTAHEVGNRRGNPWPLAAAAEVALEHCGRAHDGI